MKSSQEYLENIQGVILLISYKSNYRPTLNEILNIHPTIFLDLVEELKSTNDEFILEQIPSFLTVPTAKSRQSLIDSMGEIEGVKYFEKYFTDAAVQHLTTSNIDLPSKYQNLTSYLIINAIKEQMLESCRELNYKIDNFPIFASTRTDSFNAKAIRYIDIYPHIVLFEDEVFYFAHLLGKIIASCIPFHNGSFQFDEKPIKDYLIKDFSLIAKFAEFLIKTTATVSSRKVTPFNIPDENVILQKSLTSGMEAFIMGHEMGHIIGGHLDKSDNRSLSYDDVAELVNPSWDLEFEADDIGLKLALHALKKVNFPDNLLLWGIDALLTYMHIVDEAKSIVNSEEELTYSLGSSHPPPFIRRERIREKYLEITQNALGLKVANNISHMLLDIWNALKSQYLENYNRHKMEVNSRK